MIAVQQQPALNYEKGQMLNEYMSKAREKMSLLDRKKHILVPYSSDMTFEALKKAIQKLSGFKIDGFDEDTKTAYLHTSISWISWGEYMTVSLAQTQTGGTDVFILSTPRIRSFMLGGAIDFGKNKENIERI